MFRRHDNGDTTDRLPLLATFGQRADADAGVTCNGTGSHV
jgi:hypothetical protein